MVVFDTSIIIDALRQKKSALELLASYSEKETVATTIISKYEILRGTKEKNINFVSQFLTHFVIYDFDELSMGEAAKAYKRLKNEGKMVNELDLLIEGITEANNQTLLTKDKDFSSFHNSRIIVL